MVKQILTECPATRNSDRFLYIEFLKRTTPNACTMPLEKVLLLQEEMQIPSIETVGRARRKMQERFEELRADEVVIDARYENWKTARQYAFTE
ncbi:MAG: hypothetical protein KBT03_04575 [Bacteroidales bacterium]|nr:hypothetical protein [Candidatus Scybalousia scybalohippi]